MLGCFSIFRWSLVFSMINKVVCFFQYSYECMDLNILDQFQSILIIMFLMFMLSHFWLVGGFSNWLLNSLAKQLSRTLPFDITRCLRLNLYTYVRPGVSHFFQQEKEIRSVYHFWFVEWFASGLDNISEVHMFVQLTCDQWCYLQQYPDALFCQKQRI